MEDLYGRTIDYLRVSITDRCNLRCRYCMPQEISWMQEDALLSLEEIAAVCREAAALGIRKIKLTGGEPLLRKGCARLVGMLKQIPGIEQVTLTTNGILLAAEAEALCRQGLDAVNVSLDTLDAARYHEITGFDKLPDVLAGIEAMLAVSIPVKINAVLQAGDESGWRELIALARERPLSVRFIEMMPIGHGKEFEVVSNEAVLQQLRQMEPGLKKEPRKLGNGPAVYYMLPGYAGRVGMISAMHGKFCAGCNRIRLTAAGELKPCLCYGASVSIREAVKSGDRGKVRQRIAWAIEKKPQGHAFDCREKITETREMARIGG